MPTSPFEVAAREKRLLRRWDEIRAGAIARGEQPPPELTPEERRLAVEGNYNVEHSPEMTAHLSLTAVPDLAYILADFAWHTVHFDEPCLLTGEHPVNYWRPPERAREMMGGIGPMSCQEVRFPLSPTIGLVLVSPAFFPFRDRRGRGSRRAAAALNFWTWIAQPKRTLVMSPNHAGYPLPLGELLPINPLSTGLRDPGPIITR